MDKGVVIVGGFLAMAFVVSFSFHMLYVKGYAYSWAAQEVYQQDNGSHAPAIAPHVKPEHH